MKKEKSTSREPIIAGNWKMYGDRASVQQLLTELVNHYHSTSVQLVVFPPHIFIPQCYEFLLDSPIAWGGQNMSEYIEGAYTGEISGKMLLDFGCRYVLLGHSERRSYYGETDELVAAKCQYAIEIGLSPIVCVGETLAQRRQGLTESVIRTQLEKILTFSPILLKQIVVAYEPVWAIGTGVSASPQQAQEVHAYIRQLIAKREENIAQKLRILYGGSIKPENAAAIFAKPDIDGGLIGGASLKSQSFLDIANSWPS